MANSPPPARLFREGGGREGVRGGGEGCLREGEGSYHVLNGLGGGGGACDVHA